MAVHATFNASNKGVGAGFAPDPYPESGQCVHKMVGYPDAPGRLYMQNHGVWANWDGPGGPRPGIGVLRSDHHGHTWRSIAKGLPKKDGFFTVQRDAMDIDDLKTPALDFGTTTGQLWIGREGGEEWECLFDSLPPIHCVKVAVV